MSESRELTKSEAPAVPPKGSDSTRERIVIAAMEEFARHGIAGARVDRIAMHARTSKERVYAYFRGKEVLYAQTAAQKLGVIAQATQMDAGDLPGYAARLFDYFVAHPEHHRLITWGRLELADSPAAADDPTRASIAHKLDQIRQAQRDAKIDPAWDPVDVLALVNQIATTWAAQPEFGLVAADLAADPSISARRAAVVAAVECVFPTRA
jgi:AcrR family transcriptional regulator